MFTLLAFDGAEILDNIRQFINVIFADFTSFWFWPLIFLGLTVLAMMVLTYLIRHSYERRILKSVNNINKYFLKKPYVNEENLIEFNAKMKRVPKILRSSWQSYMLNREDGPSKYINLHNCVERPLRTSSIDKNMSNFKIFIVLLVFFSFVSGLSWAVNSLAKNNAGEIVFYASIVPLAICFLFTFYTLIIRAVRNDIYACLFENFPLYERNLTKAVSTLPSYVDYEILFTKKEIRDGIPVLQDYLEKRAIIEQKELENARANSIKEEEFDFSELGVDGSLVLDRAMKECGSFIRTRRKLQDEADAIESEKENYRKKYEGDSKDLQRKLQASRENLDSLKKQQEASTNRIETNYIRKQLTTEIAKQQQLEKDLDEANAKFDEEQKSLQNEIEERAKEIEDKKAFVEQAMLLEFKHYANTLYKSLSEKAAQITNERMQALAEQNEQFRSALAQYEGGDATIAAIDESSNFVSGADLAEGNLYYTDSNAQQDASFDEDANNQYEQTEYQDLGENAEPQVDESQGYNAQVNGGDESFAIEDETNENGQAMEQEAESQPEPQPEPQSEPQEEVSNQMLAEDEDANADGSNDGTDDGQMAVDNNQPVQPQQEEPQDELEQENEEPQAQDLVAKRSAVRQESDDLDALQQQIDAENNKLRAHKQQLDQNINDTIMNFDDGQFVQPQSTVGRARAVSRRSAVRTPARPAPRASQRPMARNASRNRISPRAQSRRASGGADDSGFDALNNEMNKLLGGR